jgi:hypothetical protein
MEREEEQRRLLTERMERARQEEARRKETQRVQTLLQQVAQWLQATNVRAYVKAVLRTARNGRTMIVPDRLESWASWALAHADEIDLIAVDNVLDQTPSG